MVHQARITKLGINVRKDYRDGPELHCFASELQQVFTNLISNALDAVSRGGTLHVGVRPSHGGSGWSSQGVRIVIADSGTGMEGAVKSRLFEPFFTTKTETGTGLGLWVTRSIVQKHGGCINVLSSPGKGTAVSIFFPHQQAAALSDPSSLPLS